MTSLDLDLGYREAEWPQRSMGHEASGNPSQGPGP